MRLLAKNGHDHVSPLLQFLRELHFIEAHTHLGWAVTTHTLQFLRELHFIEATPGRPGIARHGLQFLRELHFIEAQNFG